MPDGELPERAPGRYVSYGRDSYYLPEELPPSTEFDFDSEFQQVLQDAIYHLGRLEGIGDETDVNPLVYTSLIRREAVESVLVEGAELDFEDMFRPGEVDQGTTTKDVREAVNYETAIQRGADYVSGGGRISVRLIKELHEELLDGVRDEAQRLGKFRQHPVHIPPPAAYEAPFIPPVPEKIRPLMQNLEWYINSEVPHHDLLKLGITHYQFETIHPFGDGNGRLGRLLITLQLMDMGYLTEPFLYPSAYFNEHKLEYVRRMRAVSEEGAWEPWLVFFVEGVRQQAVDAVTRTEKLREIRRQYEHRFGHEKTAADRLAMRLFQRPYVTTSDVEEMLDVSHQTARNAISALESEEILRETTGKQRYREYKAVDIFEILTESFEE